jgi:hypothetical protein
VTSGFAWESCLDLRFCHRLVCVITGQYRSSRGPAAAQVSSCQDLLSLVSNPAGGITGGSCSSHSRRSASPLTMTSAL